MKGPIPTEGKFLFLLYISSHFIFAEIHKHRKIIFVFL